MAEQHEIPGVMQARVGIVAIPVKVRDGYVPSEVFVELRSNGTRPAVSLRIEVRQGVPMCTELRMLAHPDGPEIRPADLKGVHIDSLVEQAVALCTAHEGPEGSLSQAAPTPADRRNAQRARRRQPGRGRPPVPSQRLQQVADLYRRHADGGRPVQVIHEVLRVSERTAARYVEKCRCDGLLPPREKASAK
jgi:hypothetical protein